MAAAKTLKKTGSASRTKTARSLGNEELLSPKEAALDLLRLLPDDVSWEQLRYHLEVREGIERGLAQIAAGQHYDADEVFEELLRDVEE